MRILLWFTLLLSVIAAPSPLAGTDVVQPAAGALDFSHPAQHAAAKAELDSLKQSPFDPRALAQQFSHGIDSMLPHGQRTAPATDEYWVDPQTHRATGVQNVFRSSVALPEQFL